MKNRTPLLSVCMRTHNQERFIAEALDSVLNQTTTFDFEIIISDDCSTDGTRRLLKQYETNYPNKIRLILGDVNVGGTLNLRRVIEASTAKYVTCLDGDDYYLDRFKLQKQVDFLEEHYEFSACFHNTLNVDANGNALSLFNPLGFHDIHPFEEFVTQKWFVPIHSAVIRRDFIAFPIWYESVTNDDYVVHLSVAINAPYFYMPDVMVAYRHHSKNSSNMYQNVLYTNKQLCRILELYRDDYGRNYTEIFEREIREYKQTIAFLEREIRQPWRKYFRIKTYKRLVKSAVRKYFL